MLREIVNAYGVRSSCDFDHDTTELSRSLEIFFRYSRAVRPASFKDFVAIVAPTYPASSKMNSNIIFLPLHVFVTNIVCVHYVLIYQFDVVENLIILFDGVNQGVLLLSIIFVMLNNIWIYPGIQAHTGPRTASKEQASCVHSVLVLS